MQLLGIATDDIIVTIQNNSHFDNDSRWNSIVFFDIFWNKTK